MTAGASEGNVRLVPISRMRTGGLYTFAYEHPHDDPGDFVRVFVKEPRDGVNPYIDMGVRLNVRDELGAWIPWLFLGTRTVTFLISPAQGRTSIKSRTTRMTLHHIATSEGRGWIEMPLIPHVRGGVVREVSAPSISSGPSVPGIPSEGPP